MPCDPGAPVRRLRKGPTSIGHPFTVTRRRGGSNDPRFIENRMTREGLSWSTCTRVQGQATWSLGLGQNGRDPTTVGSSPCSASTLGKTGRLRLTSNRSSLGLPAGPCGVRGYPFFPAERDGGEAAVWCLGPMPCLWLSRAGGRGEPRAPTALPQSPRL